MRKKLASLAVLLGLCAAFLGFAPPASADTIIGQSLLGCNGPQYHYRLTEYKWQNPQGQLYKTFYIDLYGYGAGGTFQLIQQNAWYGWAEWETYPRTVVQNSYGWCFFVFSEWPGFGWKAVHFNTTTQTFIGKWTSNQWYERGEYQRYNHSCLFESNAGDDAHLVAAC